MQDEAKQESEWRIVDAAGAPWDTGVVCWPLYESEQDARDQLELARDDRDDDEPQLQVREVGPWETFGA
jgi:hypothetical protein